MKNRTFSKRQWRHIWRNHRVAMAKRNGTFVRFNRDAAARAQLVGVTLWNNGMALLRSIHSEIDETLATAHNAENKMERIGKSWQA